MLEPLIWLILGIAVIAVVGHVIWLLIAAFFRMIFGGQVPEIVQHASPGSFRSHCPRCDTRLINGDCPICFWPARGMPQTDRTAALITFERKIRRYAELNLVDSESARRLCAVLAEEIAAAGQARPAPTPRMPGQATEIVALVSEPQQPSVPASAQSHAFTPIPAVPTPREVGDRVADFVARRTADTDLPTERSQVGPTPETQALAPPKRAWSDLLAHFMEEKNIRWGELVGGLLIVCCSIALVISFWTKIAERPFLKFFVFNGITTGLFGVGLYTHYRWKLKTTSDGLLIIASLLVPLNFLAIAAFTRAPDVQDIVTITGEIVSIALFTTLVYSTGRVILGAAPWLLTMGVMVPSVFQLLVRRVVTPQEPMLTLVLFAAIPMLVLLAVVVTALLKSRKSAEWDEPQLGSLFKLGGLALFAALVPLALLSVKTGNGIDRVRQIAVAMPLLALSPLLLGLTVWRRVTAASLVSWRTAGTAIAIAGAALLVAANTLAWPIPARLIPVSLTTGVLLIGLGAIYRLPILHVPAIACAAVGALQLYYVRAGSLAYSETSAVDVLNLVVSGHSGVALTPLALAVGAVGLLVGRLGRRDDSLFVLAGAGVVAAVSLGLATWYGALRPGDPLHLSWVYGMYAVLALIVAGRLQLSGVAWIGSALLLAVCIQAVVFGPLIQYQLGIPWLTALTVYSAACSVAALLVARFASAKRDVYLHPLLDGALAVSIALTALLAWFLLTHWPSELWAYALAVAAIWLLAAATLNSSALLIAAQTLSYVAAGLAVLGGLERFDRFVDSPRRLLDPRTLQAEAIAAACLSLGWILLRAGFTRMLARSSEQENSQGTFVRLVSRTWPSADSAAVVLCVFVLVGVAAYAAIPGTAQELSPRTTSAMSAAAASSSVDSDLDTFLDDAPAPVQLVVPRIEGFQLAGIPHQPAQQWPSWLLLFVIAVVLVAQGLEGRAGWSGLALLVVAATVCPLIASMWESQVAVASALRWTSAMFLLAGSALIWSREPLLRLLGRLKFPMERFASGSESPQSAIAATILLSLLPLLLMGAAVSISAVNRSPGPLPGLDALPILGVVFVVATVLALGLQTLTDAFGEGVTRRVSMMATETLPVRSRPAWVGQARSLLLLLGAAPAIVVTLFVVATALRHSPVLGPDPASAFAQMGLAASYAIPVLITAMTLIGYAIRERSSRFAFAGGLVLSLAVTAGYLLSLAKTGLTLDFVQWARIAQLNAIVAALFALCWMAAIGALSKRRKIASNELLATQVGLPMVLNAAVLLPAWLWLIAQPVLASQLAPLSGAWGWTAAVLAAGAAIAWSRGSSGADRSIAPYGIGLSAAAILIVLSISGYDSGNWLAYHAMLVGHVLLPYATLVVGAFGQNLPAKLAQAAGLSAPNAAASDDGMSANEPDSRARSESRSIVLRWVLVSIFVAVVLALRALFGDPQAPWWSFGAVAAVCPVVIALACWGLAPRLLGFAAVLINLAATIAAVRIIGLGRFDEFIELAYVNVAALALPVVGWLFIHLRVYCRRIPATARRQVPLHRFAAGLSLCALVGLIAVGLLHDVQGQPLAIWPPLAWSALVCVGVAITACLWDERARGAIPGLYVWGIALLGLTLDQLNLNERWLWWNGTLALAAYTLLTSYLWSRRHGLAIAARQLGIPAGDPDADELYWLVPANLAAVLLVIVSTVTIEFTFAEFSLRIAVAKASLAQALAVGLIARGTRRTPLQYISLLLGVFGVVAIGWSMLEPGVTSTVLNRAVVLLAAVAAMTVLYGLGLSKLLSSTSEWTLAAQRLIPALTAIAAATLLVVLAVEVAETMQYGEVAISMPAIVAVAATLLGLAIAAMLAAVLPGRDPFQLSERGRQVYVYAAEAILALLFVHIRLTMPWLFHGFFQQYWPLVVMLLAFFGGGVGELLRRRKITVVGEPLENTGAMLPLLPVLGYWALPTRVDYGLLLLSVAVLYGALSAARRSFPLAIVSILAGNGALWHFLHHQEGYRLLEHPQLWLIPPALSVLAASYVNRRQLSVEQMTAIRYACSTIIYVSSTADIFINGVAQNPWLPLVLAGLSILGVFAGILLRVRAFLFLGLAFLSLALFTIIWHAAVDLDQIWIWYVCGIVAGALVIALFAVFEKKRQEILEVVERLKQWEA